MKSCPCCGSGKVKEYKVNGIWAMICHKCGYDSAAKDRHYSTHDRERAREEGQKGKPKR